MVKTEFYSEQIRRFKYDVSTNFDVDCSLRLSRCSVTAHNTFCPLCVKGANNGYGGDLKSSFPLAGEKMKKYLSVFYYRA